VIKLAPLVGRLSIYVLAILILGATAVDAEPSISGPVVSSNRTEVAPGDLVVLTIDRFKARTVTISICGNQARRGSVDCNMTASKGLRLDVGTATVAQMGITSPPVGCPCVVRVSSQTNDEVAVTPIDLSGHPIEPVVGGSNLNAPLVAVSIRARAASRGLFDRIRSGLGGAVNYQVTVTVKNLTTEPVHRVNLSASVRRNQDTLADLAFDDTVEIGPGQTWKQVVSAEMPAPSLGSIEWQVAATQAGPLVLATSTTRHHPVLLLLLTMTLVVDVALLAIRHRMRRRAVREMTGDETPSLRNSSAAA
jgi:sortase A